jgi:hypothetical protein
MGHERVEQFPAAVGSGGEAAREGRTAPKRSALPGFNQRTVPDVSRRMPRSWPRYSNAAAAHCWSSQGKRRFDRRSTKPHRTSPRPSRGRRSGDDGRARKSPFPSLPSWCAASRERRTWRSRPRSQRHADTGGRARVVPLAEEPTGARTGSGPWGPPHCPPARARGQWCPFGSGSARQPPRPVAVAARRKHRAAASPGSSRAQE